MTDEESKSADHTVPSVPSALSVPKLVVYWVRKLAKPATFLPEQIAPAQCPEALNEYWAYGVPLTTTVANAAYLMKLGEMARQNNAGHGVMK